MASLFDSDLSKAIPPCPTCGGLLERVYSRFGESVHVCVDCHTGVTIPRKAWEIAGVKETQRDKSKPNVG